MSRNNSNGGNDAHEDDNDSVASALQVRITLTLAPECLDRTLQVPKDVIAVPADAGRKGLSAVINHLLDRKIQEDEKDDEEKDDDPNEDDDDNNNDARLPAIPFECIVGRTNRLLLTGIEREARRLALTLEEAIPIIYFPAQQAPESSGESEPLPDWVSAMSAIPSRNLVVCSCYDGSIAVYNDNHNDDSTVLKEVSRRDFGHGGPIHCLATTIAHNTHDGKDKSTVAWIATGAMDHSLHLHTLDGESNELKYYASCSNGHVSAISSVDLNKKEKLLASGDWDGTLCIWDFSKEAMAHDSDKRTSTKKSKTDSSSSGSTAAKASSSFSSPTLRKTLEATSSIGAHASNISGISWGNFAKINETDSQHHYLTTGSWDHSIKVWDVQRQDTMLTLNGSRVVSCLDTSYHSADIVATGHPDCTIRLWDTRAAVDSAKESSLVVADTTFRPSHKEWITAVNWSPNHAFHLASTSHDGNVKLWDIRSSLPLHTIRAFPKGVKGLSLCYGNSGNLYVGGTDCVVKQLNFADADES